MFIYIQMIETAEDQSKFEKIYTEYMGLMFHAAFMLLQHRQDAEDAVHQAFVSIAENILSIADPICPKTKAYVVTIAENKAIDMLRKKNRHPSASLNEDIHGIEVHYDGDNFLAEAIFKLSALQRQVIWLKYHQGYNLKEIAKILGITHSWATKIDQRAKAKLRQIYEEGGYSL